MTEPSADELWDRLVAEHHALLADLASEMDLDAGVADALATLEEDGRHG